MTKTFADYDIDTRGRAGNIKTTCPQCSHTRKNSKDPCLSANTDDGLWNCHHCGWTGSLKSSVDCGLSRSKKTYKRPTYQPTDQHQEPIFDWFSKRGIPHELVTRHKISLSQKYVQSIGIMLHRYWPHWD